MRLKILMFLLFAALFITQAIAEELIGESQAGIKEIKGGTRMIISTSGPAKFSSYWLDDPSRLVVEFQSKNVVTKLDNEVEVNQGVIRRITSSYFEGGAKRALKSLTIEFNQKVPYRIRSEDNAILLDIQAPLKTESLTGQALLGTSLLGVSGKETFAAGDVIIKRLEAMDAALTQTARAQAPLETPEAEIKGKTLMEPSKTEEEVVLPKTKDLPTLAGPTRGRRNMLSTVFWPTGLVLLSALGFLVRDRDRSNQKLKEFKLKLQEKSKLLEQERVVRNLIEKTSLEKEREHQQLKGSFESLKGELIKKGLVKRELSPEEKERSWIPEKSPERRVDPRLPLTRDFNKTVILRIESPNLPQRVKSFTNNISSKGLSFETKEEFKEKEPVNLRLFFYGDIVPAVKVQAHIAWKKKVAPINYYGVSFDSLAEKDKLGLVHYIESKK